MLGSGGGMIPVETQERMYDYMCERYVLRPDSGGPGRFRGGLGIQKDYRFMRQCYVSARTDRWKFPPVGVEGGSAGAPGSFVLNPGTAGERHLHSKFSELAVDDVPFAVGNDVSDGRITRRRIVGSDIGMNEQLYLSLLRSLQGERGHA